jgi:predicted DNA-binding transcriptional regulator YafY
MDLLIELGFPINYETTIRSNITSTDKDEAECSVISDLWIDHNFTDSELRLLIDGILFSNHLPQNQRSELIKKLSGLSSKYFSPHVKHVYTPVTGLPQNKQIFYTIETLDEAITKKRKVRFIYMDYGTDKKLHPRCREDGSVRVYTVNPYQMAAKTGKYYLICNYEKYNDVSNYRIDRISDIEILDEPIKPFSELKDSQGMPLDLAKYMAQHIYMYTGEIITVKFSVAKTMISDVIDMFGKDVEFLQEDPKRVVVRARVSKLAMFQFAKNFEPDVIVLEPKNLASQICENAQKTLDAYSKVGQADAV